MIPVSRTSQLSVAPSHIDPGAPGHGALELDPSLEQEPGIAQLERGRQFELLPARFVLRVVCVVEENAAAHSNREERALVLVPAHQPSPRVDRLRLASLEGTVHRRLLGLRRLLAGADLRPGCHEEPCNNDDGRRKPGCHRLDAIICNQLPGEAGATHRGEAMLASPSESRRTRGRKWGRQVQMESRYEEGPVVRSGRQADPALPLTPTYARYSCGRPSPLTQRCPSCSCGRGRKT